MNNKLNSRFEYFLGLVAGRKEADITTLTPPAPSNMTELLLMQISEIMNGASKNVQRIAANVPYAHDTVTAADSDALIQSLVDAGFIKVNGDEPAPSGDATSNVVGIGQADYMTLRS